MAKLVHYYPEKIKAVKCFTRLFQKNLEYKKLKSTQYSIDLIGVFAVFNNTNIFEVNNV